MRNLYTAILFLFIANASFAQFSGDYAPSNWTTFLSPGSTGSVDPSGAPNTIIINGSDGNNASNVDVDYTITLTNAGRWRFTWSYHTNDQDASAEFDIAGILINGVFTQLSNNSAGPDQSGNYTSAFLSAGTQIGFRIRATDNIMGDASLTISNFSVPSPSLPVNLFSFNGQNKNGNIELEWKCGQEENLAFYQLEHSTDGRVFGLISNVPADHKTSYTTTHGSPVAGMNYYRLKMVDQDGDFAYSKIIAIKATGISSIRLFPNPAINTVNIGFNASEAGKDELQVYDATGRMILSQSLVIKKGSNFIPISINSLSQGSYTIRLATNGLNLSFMK